MARGDDSPVTAAEVAELALEVIARTSDLAARPYALIAAFKSAASDIENAIASNALRTTIAAAVANMMNAGRR